MSVTDLPDYTGYSDIENVYGDVKIYTPSGLWVVGSDLLTSSSHYVASNVPAGTETTVLSLSGRGRVKAIGFYIASSTIGGVSVYTQTRIRVYIDGETTPSINVSPAQIDDFAGRLLLQQHNYNFNSAVSGSLHVYFAQVVPPLCGLTYLMYNSDYDYYPAVGGFIIVNGEFISSAEIKIYNGGSDDAIVRMLIIYGEYL